jgi:hypothetical protein
LVSRRIPRPCGGLLKEQADSSTGIGGEFLAVPRKLSLPQTHTDTEDGERRDK